MSIEVTQREAIARIIDPCVWHEGGYPAERSRIAARQSQALGTADRIIALHAAPLREALETTRDYLLNHRGNAAAEMALLMIVDSALSTSPSYPMENYNGD